MAGFFAALSEGVELAREWGASLFSLDMNAWRVNGIAVAEWLPFVFAVIAIQCAGLTTYKKGWPPLPTEI